MQITPAQTKALSLFNTVPCVTYSPGESLYIGKENVRWDVVRKLDKNGYIEGYSIHPWGIYPVYALSITDKGRSFIKSLTG